MQDIHTIRLIKAISDSYASKMVDYGPMHIAINECFTGYIHSFHIRALLSHNKEFKNEKWEKAVRYWVEWSLRMQGSYGDSAAYNMGYLFETKDGMPENWFIADTLDQAYALLNFAYELNPHDDLYPKLLKSLLEYDKYIQTWYHGEDGFAVGFIDGKKSTEEPYHTACTRGVCYYSAMYKVFGKECFRKKGLALLEYVLEKLDFSSNYHGSPLHNRCYASDALVNAYYVLSKGDEKLQKRICVKMQKDIIPWAIENQTIDGFWPHDRFGYQPGAMKVIDKSKLGAYSWGLLLGLEIFSHILPDDNKLNATLQKSYTWLEENIDVTDENRWGYHSWATLAFAAKKYPQNIFPFGEYIPSRKECGELTCV